ncbi:hypothetical protein Goshw_012233 [Gossypium schwendimanii]|uniref:Uncharacterized protein n=1 Tax=Gossypium schwendimanii TaxID=34291 RepID=A0A7J9NF37_GOSSC|nr:hypothetical protein [Gossypium schwendimanii]
MLMKQSLIYSIGLIRELH